MIIVRFKGGLGNQLFQYGLYRHLQILGKDVKADILDYEEKIDFRKFLLEEIGIRLEYAKTEDIVKYRGKRNNIIEIVRRKYGLRKRYFGENEDIFSEGIFQYSNKYLDGFWQNELYFKNIELELRGELTNIFYRNRNINELESKITLNNSVSIHIRRGDYVQKNSIYKNLGETDYYDKAIEYMRKRLEKPMFFLFSDDTDWLKQKYQGQEFIIVEDYKGKPEQEDLILMSKCKHNIIANSSYSWWAAWINHNSDKIVIAPKEWYSINKKSNVVCDNWLSI